MRKALLKISVLCAILGIGLAGIVMANGALIGDDVAMMVSPSTIVLGRMNIISVHTNIPAGIVASLFLNGADPVRLYADDLGHIAAKFRVADLGLEDSVTTKKKPNEVTMVLCGSYKEDLGDFYAEDVVKVKQLPRR